MGLDKEELERYNRNILLSGIGEEGQQKLKNAKVLVVGGWWAWFAGVVLSSGSWSWRDWDL